MDITEFPPAHVYQCSSRLCLLSRPALRCSSLGPVSPPQFSRAATLHPAASAASTNNYSDYFRFQLEYKVSEKILSERRAR